VDSDRNYTLHLIGTSKNYEMIADLTKLTNLTMQQVTYNMIPAKFF